MAKPSRKATSRRSTPNREQTRSRVPGSRAVAASEKVQQTPDTRTDKQARFVELYLIEPNATRAYQEAYGATEAVAAANGSRLLRNAKVAAAIDAGIQARSERTGITADVVLGELLRLARVDIGEAFDEDGRLLPIKDIPPDVRRAISGIEIDELWDVDVDEESGRKKKVQTGYTRKVKFWDKKGALELLGRHLKLFTDKLEVSGNINLAERLQRAMERAG